MEVKEFLLEHNICFADDILALKLSCKELYFEQGIEEAKKYIEQINQELLNEGVVSGVLTAFKALFKNKPKKDLKTIPIADGKLLKSTKEQIKKLYKIGQNIQSFREKQWTYRKIRQWYDDDELVIMSNALGYPAEDEDMSAENKKKWSYKWRMFVFTINPFNGPKLMKVGLKYSALPIEYALATLLFLIEKVYGKIKAENIFKEAQQAVTA